MDCQRTPKEEWELLLRIFAPKVLAQIKRIERQKKKRAANAETFRKNFSRNEELEILLELLAALNVTVNKFQAVKDKRGRLEALVAASGSVQCRYLLKKLYFTNFFNSQTGVVYEE